MRDLKEVLIKRDGLTEEQACRSIDEARNELLDRLANGEYAFDICEEYFNLEPDYLEDLI